MVLTALRSTYDSIYSNILNTIKPTQNNIVPSNINGGQNNTTNTPSGVTGNAAGAQLDPNKSLTEQASTLVNDQFIEFLASYEGIHINDRYWDYAQHTTGIGTRSNSEGDVATSWDDAVQRAVKEIAKEQLPHIDKLNQQRQANGHAALTVPQVYAFMSFYFNLGTAQSETLDKLIIEGKDQEASQKALEYSKAGSKTLKGLKDRRKAEASLIAGGTQFIYGPAHSQIKQHLPQNSGTLAVA